MNFNNLKIGHTTLQAKGTGVTVFLFEQPAACGWSLCGAAPATRDVNIIDPTATVEKIDALVFGGGSAYGLGATNGVMQWLLEHKRGYVTRYGLVPLVPTADIYDFGVNGMHFPSPEDAYQACQNAQKNNTMHGRVGVGTGATVGKWMHAGHHIMSGGFGFAQLEGPDGLQVLVCAVVNSVGDVINEQGQVVAGAKKKDGSFLNMPQELSAGHFGKTDISSENTTLVAVFTNAILQRAQLTRIAKMASAGIARATMPAFTRYDGDVVFAASLDRVAADEMVVGTLAALATHKAILQAVEGSVII